MSNEIFHRGVVVYLKAHTLWVTLYQPLRDFIPCSWLQTVVYHLVFSRGEKKSRVESTEYREQEPCGCKFYYRPRHLNNYSALKGAYSLYSVLCTLYFFACRKNNMPCILEGFSRFLPSILEEFREILPRILESLYIFAALNPYQ